MEDRQYVEAKANLRQQKYDLETVEGGWVELVRMNHGQSLERLDTILRLSVSDDGRRSARASNVLGRRFDFAHCIVDHNLAFEGDPCDFTDVTVVDELDEDLGDEIQNLINAHHGRAMPGLADGPESDPN